MSNSYETILVERRGGVALVTINRPEKRNALNIQTRAEGAAVLDKLRADDSVRVVVLTGAGDKAFIAGADIAEFAGRGPMDQREAMRFPRLYDVMSDYPKPVIAMINGFCLGGGCELAMSCDIRVASDKARFGQPEINLGVLPGAGGTQRLPRAVGKAVAMDMILTGRMLTAAEARELGLVARVVAKEAWLDEAKRVAREIGAKGPVSVRLAKEAVDEAFEAPLSAGLEFERRAFYLARASEDATEGLNAFVEKRRPEWRGR